MPGAGTSTQNQNIQKTQQEQGTTASNTAGTTQGTQQQNSNVGPWSETQPLLSSILGSLQGLSATPNPAQSEAVAGLQSSANAIPNFGSAGAGAVNDFLGGTYKGMLGDSLANYKSSLSPYLSSSYLDPMSTPGLSDALNTMKSDVTNSVNSQFAAAGRDLSPANSTALARGITQGVAPTIANQFNQNVATQRGAQDALLGAGTNNVGMLSNLGAAGINLAGQIPGLYTSPAASQFGAANAGYALPFSNLGMLSGLTLPIAGLGQSGTTSGTTSGSTAGNTAGTYSGTGSGTQVGESSSTMSPLQMLSSLFGSGGSATGMGNAVGTGLGMLGSLFSDERVKEDIEPVGMLFDKTPVYSYRYIGDETPRIGLIAQDVEHTAPEAVTEIGGVKAVHYGKATERARAIGGMLSDLQLAA